MDVKFKEFVRAVNISSLRNKPVKCYIESIAFIVLEDGHFGKKIINTWKILN